MSNIINLSARQLQASLHCSADNDIRYYLNGVLVESGAGTTRIVSTNGHILYAHDYRHGDIDQWQGSFIIPRAAIETLKPKQERGGYDHVTIEVNDDGKSGYLVMMDRRIGFTAISGHFPDYCSVIPATAGLSHGEHWVYDKDDEKDFVALTCTTFNDYVQDEARHMSVPRFRAERIADALNARFLAGQFSAVNYAAMAKIGKVWHKTGNFYIFHAGECGTALVMFRNIPSDHNVLAVMMPVRGIPDAPVTDTFRSPVFVEKKETPATEETQQD